MIMVMMMTMMMMMMMQMMMMKETFGKFGKRTFIVTLNLTFKII